MELISKRFDQLTANELYEILRVRAEVFVVEQNIIYQDMDFKDMRSTHLFYTDNERILSYLRIIDAGVKYPEYSIGRVLTIKEHRNQGLSRNLVIKALSMIRESSDWPVKIEAQSYLKDFYESIGFVPISDEFILEGIPHIGMIYTKK